MEERDSTMDDISVETRNFIEYIFYTFVIRIICIIGIFGNIIILLVLSRRALKETAFVYIRALAAVDLIINIVVLGLSYIRGSGGDQSSSPTLQYYGRLYEGFLYLPVANAAQMANLFITIAMAVHRVASVIKIHNGIDMYTVRINVLKSRTFAKRVVMMILLFSAGINTIRFFFHTIKEEQIPGVLHTGCELRELNEVAKSTLTINESDRRTAEGMIMSTGNNASQLAMNPTPAVRYVLANTPFFQALYQHFMIALSTLHLCELLTLTTVNVILIGVLRRSKNQRKQLIPVAEVQRRKKTDDVTKMLVVTVLVHVVCHLHSPLSADPIAAYVFGENYVKTNTYHIQRVINNAFTLTSHAVTFFLYLVSAKFRDQVKRAVARIFRGLHIPAQPSFNDSNAHYSWTPSKGGASPILHRKHSIRTLHTGASFRV